MTAAGNSIRRGEMRRLFTDSATVHAAVTLLLVAPFFVLRDIPLYDLPNHIARQHILFGDGAPGAAQYYVAQWRLLPNLALDAWVGAFHHLVSVDLAVRLFLAATVTQLFWGTIALNRALFGPRSRFALVAASFAFNGPFLLGFVNLCFGLGMALWTMAAWIKWRDRGWALPLFAFLSCLILLAHLFAFAIYAVIVIAFELGELQHGWRAVRREFLALLHLAAPAVLYLGFMPREVTRGAIYYLPWLEKFGALRSVLGFYNPQFDVVCLALLLLGGLLVAARVQLARAMMLPLAALVIADIGLPHQLGEGTFVDYRMPTVLALFLSASLGWREGERRTRRVAESLVLLLFAFRMGAMLWQWHSWQPDFAQYRAAFAQLPEGAKLLPLAEDPNALDPLQHPPLGHIAALAVSERGALIPDLFAERGHQLLRYREPRLFDLNPSAASSRSRAAGPSYWERSRASAGWRSASAAPRCPGPTRHCRAN